MEVYTPDGKPQDSWRPQITSCPSALQIAQTYVLQGKLINGLSQAVSYGDDATMATNYPLVRLRNLSNNKIWYCRTHDHSTMAVATGAAIHSTHFTVPCGPDKGQYELCVIANGIASIGVTVTVAPFTPQIVVNEAAVAYLIGSLADGPLYVLTPHGPVPVDPWGPNYAEPAKAAYESIIRAVKTLRDLGRQLEAEQQAAANAASRVTKGGKAPPKLPKDARGATRRKVAVGKKGAKK